MATALIYVLVLLVVAALFFLGASAFFGRGEELAPLPPGASPTWLPADEVAAGDVRAVRFQQAVRGYRMVEVDWVLDRVAGELDRVAGELGRVTGELDRVTGELERVTGERDELRRRLGPAGTVGPGSDDEPAPEEARDVTGEPDVSRARDASEERTEA